MKKKVYAVRKGRKTGIFYSWKECETHVKGYSGAQYHSFPSKKEAQQYLSSSLIKNKKHQVSPPSQNIKEQQYRLINGVASMGSDCKHFPIVKYLLFPEYHVTRRAYLA